MKLYQIKKPLALQLKELSGFILFSENYNSLADECEESYRCCVLSLPKTCNKKLVYTVLEQVQRDKLTLGDVKLLAEYLNLAERNDQTVEANADAQEMCRKVFLGLVYVTLGVSGFGLAVLLMVLSQISANCALFLLCPAALSIAWGIIKSMQGCVQFSRNTSSQFSEKEYERVLIIEEQLFQMCSQLNQQPQLFASDHSFFSCPVANDTPMEATQVRMDTNSLN